MSSFFASLRKTLTSGGIQLYFPRRPLPLSILLIGLCLCDSTKAADWTSTDTAWQLGYTATLIVDCAQTRNMGRDPKFRERNPVVGEFPSKGRVDNICLATGLAHFGISYALPPDWRRIWQIGSVGAEIIVIRHNYQIGLRMEF